jgi:two-component system NarL family response regulator
MGANEKIKIMVVDDHYVVRVGLVGILSLQPDCTVVAQAEDGEQAVRAFRECRPDVTLMDARMPGMNGIDAITSIRRDTPNARIIMLTTYDGDEDIFRALQAGAIGYLLKSTPGPVLVKAVRAVHQGQRFIPPDVAARMAARIPCSELSDRELEVLHLVVKGLSNKEIADQLAFTEHTAKAHVRNILLKLGVADRTQAATTALQRGIVHLP